MSVYVSHTVRMLGFPEGFHLLHQSSNEHGVLHLSHARPLAHHPVKLQVVPAYRSSAVYIYTAQSNTKVALAVNADGPETRAALEERIVIFVAIGRDRDNAKHA
jgi:hypothetical protein